MTVVAASRASALAEAEHEYRRLLYVAMTRAAERLIVCGAEGERGRPKGCWYDLIREALQPALVEAQDGDDKVWRYRKPADDVSDNALPAHRYARRARQNPGLAAFQCARRNSAGNAAFAFGRL